MHAFAGLYNWYMMLMRRMSHSFLFTWMQSFLRVTTSPKWYIFHNLLLTLIIFSIYLESAIFIFIFPSLQSYIIPFASKTENEGDLPPFHAGLSFNQIKKSLHLCISEISWVDKGTIKSKPFFQPRL